MRNEVWKAGLVVFAAVSLIMLPLLGGCATTEETTPSGKPAAPPSTEKPAIPEGATIKIGDFADLTGPYAPEGVWAAVYAKAFYRYVNEELGGINGIPVEHLWVDTQLQVPKATPAIHRWSDEGVCCITTYVSQMTEGMKPLCEELQIPLLGGYATSYIAAFPPGWVYLNACTYVEQWVGFLTWLKKNWKEDRPPKVGLLLFDTVTGRSLDTPESWEAASQLGIDVHLPIEYFAVSATTHMPQLKRLAEAGVDWVFVSNFGELTAITMKDAERLGIRDKIGFCGTWVSTNEGTFDLGGDAVEGFKSVYFFAAWDEDVPEVKTMTKWVTKEHGSVYKSLAGINQWGSSKLAYEAVKMTLEREGWPVTGDGVNRTLQDMKDFPIGVSGDITFGPQRRVGSYSMRIIELQKGKKWVPASDWFEAPQVIGKEYFMK